MSSKKIMITLSEKKADELEKLARERGVTKSVFVALAIEELSRKGGSDENK